MPPDATQLALLWAAGVAFAAAFFSAWRQIRAPRTPAQSETDPAPTGHVLGPVARIAFAIGSVLAVALVAWRVVAEGNRGASPNSPPLFNFFDLFLLLGILLVAISIYFRITRRLRSLTFFLLPIIALVFVLGGVLSLLNNRAFEYHSVANVLHVVSILISSIAFALGCAGGIVYLLADRQLKAKGEHRLVKFPSLASIERFNLHAVLIGFPLLTLAMISGGIILYHRTKDASWSSPKVLLAIASWLIYGVLIHIPLAPSFRGRRAAWLIIVGFVMLLSVFFAIRS